MIALDREEKSTALTLVNGALSDWEFTSSATAKNRNYQHFTRTTICINVKLSGLTKTTTPKWDDILNSDEAKEAKKAEINLGVINVHKGLKENSAVLRKELDGIQRMMIREGDDWVTTVEMLPKVWAQLIELRDTRALELRQKLLSDYADNYAEYERRINQFLDVSTWTVDQGKKEIVRRRLLQSFPTQSEVENCLVVHIGKPIIIPGFQEQLDEQQAQILETIRNYSREYDRNLRDNVRTRATQEAESIVAEMLGELANWEPGYKPVQFKKKIERHLQRVEVVRSAITIAQQPLSEVISTLEDALTNINGKESEGEMIKIRQKLLGDQAALKNEISQEIGMTSATLSAMKL